MKTITKFLTALLLLGTFAFVNANNLTITNVSLTGATSSTIQVQYNMFWENSWRDLENWDAAWVFVKYSTDNGITWSHATMSSSGHVAGTSTPTASIHIPQDNLGAFVYRSSVSSGTYTITNQQLQWNFVANGLNQTQAAGATVRVFGMEMVYIPQGEFYLGDGVNTTSTPSPSLNAFYRLDANSSAAFIYSSMSERIQDNQYGTFRVHGLNGVDLNNDTIVGSWPTDAPDFPVGYKALYCMKHKITQGQYTDFLNTLTYDQQSQRVGNANNTVAASAWNGSTTTLPTHRNNIFVLTAGVSNTLPRIYTATRPDRDCNFLNWPDACSYADWAGLRPYTDMEKEKIGRGPVPPVLGEFASGSNSYTAITAVITGVENGQETATSTGHNFQDMHSNSTISGGDGSFNRAPIRAGIFARSSTTRLQSGASYYGVMDFTGGLIEWVVSFSQLAGRSYTGLHGNGSLNSAGFADVSFWPGINGNASYGTANTAYSGSTGVTSGAGAVFTGLTNPSTTSAMIGPRYGTSYTQYTTWPLSSRMTHSDMNQATTSTSSGKHTSYTNRYQQVGFRAVKSNL